MLNELSYPYNILALIILKKKKTQHYEWQEKTNYQTDSIYN